MLTVKELYERLGDLMGKEPEAADLPVMFSSENGSILRVFRDEPEGPVRGISLEEAGYMAEYLDHAKEIIENSGLKNVSADDMEYLVELFARDEPKGNIQDFIQYLSDKQSDNSLNRNSYDMNSIEKKPVYVEKMIGGEICNCENVNSTGRMRFELEYVFNEDIICKSVDESVYWYSLDDTYCISAWFSSYSNCFYMKLEYKAEDGSMGPFCEQVHDESYTSWNYSKESIIAALREIADDANLSDVSDEFFNRLAGDIQSHAFLIEPYEKQNDKMPLDKQILSKRASASIDTKKGVISKNTMYER